MHVSCETKPFVSVVIRSHNRLESMIELAQMCQKQDYEPFEILIIEQSDESLRDKFEGELASLSTDTRVKILYFGRLGPAGARNVAIPHAKGEILIFIDDDDIPADTNWIKNHVKNFQNPNCVAVTGREFVEGEEGPSIHNTEKNYRLCLRYSFLKMPRARTRHTRRLTGVTALQGTNAAIRKEIIERVGGWDEDVECHEENSFDFKFQRLKKPEEYYVYEPDAAIVRRLEIEGGLGRRQAKTETILKGEYLYSFQILKRYFPVRFYSFIGIYIFLVIQRTFIYMKKSQPELSRKKIISDAFTSFFRVIRQNR
jgi:glycosyltransferase involved in cell wall biosynthesis